MNSVRNTDKIIPIVDKTKEYPAFFVSDNLNKEELAKIIKSYEFIFMQEEQKIHFLKTQLFSKIKHSTT